MSREEQKGVALIMTLIVLAVLSVMAVSFMFLSQSETWSTMNYRLTSQARDGAEAGINSATDFLVNSYTAPGTGGGCASDVLGCYTLTTYPVQSASNNNPVILSASSSVSSNYPISSVQDAFNTDGVGYGSINAGNTTVNYATSARLLAMRQVTVYGGTQATVQTWLITSDGTINNGVRNAQVELTAILDKPVVPTFSYGAFGQSNQCSAITVDSHGATVNSYDSSAYGGSGSPSTQSYGGNVGTNGNLNLSGNVTIDGSLSTPAVGTGTCVNGPGGANTAETLCNNCSVAGGLVELPQAVNYPLPALPSPMPPLTAQSGNSDCGNVPNCTTIASKDIRLDPGTYGQLSMGSSMSEVHLHNGGGTNPGIYNIDSFSLGNATLVIDSGPVILNVTGCATLNGSNTDCATYLSTAIDLQSGAIANTTYDPLNLQIQYGGPGDVNIQSGGTAPCALVYAPAANVTLTGNATFYGAVIGNAVNFGGGAVLAYDRNLRNSSYTVGNFMLGGFSWSRF